MCNRKELHLVSFYCMILFLQSCASLKINGTANNVVVLANKDSNCSSREIKTWFFLWGMVPIGKQIDSENLFLEQNKSYRITQKYTNTDILINLPVSFITSFIRKTIQIEACPKDFILVPKEEFNHKEDPTIFLGEKKKIIITLKNNKSYTYQKLNLVIREGEYFYESLEDENSKVPQSIRGEDVKQIVIKESK